MKNNDIIINIGSCLVSVGLFESITSLLHIPNSIVFGAIATVFGGIILVSECIRGEYYDG